MAWDLIHTTKDDTVYTSRWEDEKGWYYKVEIGRSGEVKTGITVFVEDIYHISRNLRFDWRRANDLVWCARVHGGELHRRGVGESFKLSFAAGSVAEPE